MTTNQNAFQLLARRDGICTGQEHADALSAAEPMRTGDRVYWTQDDEGGTVLDITEYAITIDWDCSGIETYALACGAIERIKPRTLRFSCSHKR